MLTETAASRRAWTDRVLLARSVDLTALSAYKLRPADSWPPSYSDNAVVVRVSVAYGSARLVRKTLLVKKHVERYGLNEINL